MFMVRGRARHLRHGLHANVPVKPKDSRFFNVTHSQPCLHNELVVNMKTVKRSQIKHFAGLVVVAFLASCAASTSPLPMATCPSSDLENESFQWKADRESCDISGTPHFISTGSVLQALRHGPDVYGHPMEIVNIKYVDQNWDEAADLADTRITNGATVTIISGAHASKVVVEVDEVTRYYCFMSHPSHGENSVVTPVSQ